MIGRPRFQERLRASARSNDALAYTQGDWESAEDEGMDGTGSSAWTNRDTPTNERDAEISRRLIALDASYFEVYGRELSRDSRAGFECFMRYNDYRIPLLGAEEGGTIVATWKSGQECVSVRFLTRYYVDFAVTYSTGQGLKRKWGRSNLAAVHSECPHLRRLADSQ